MSLIAFFCYFKRLSYATVSVRDRNKFHPRFKKRLFTPSRKLCDKNHFHKNPSAILPENV